MKENERCVYVREYSEIPGLQKAGDIRYEVCGDTGVYHFRVVCRPGGKIAVFRLAGASREQAHNLLLFLYENSVEPELAAAVVQDCVEQEAAVLPETAE